MQYTMMSIQSGDHVMGIKGSSPLSSHISIINIPNDYMHALAGAVKTLMTFWFDKKNHGKVFYIGRQCKEIDKMLVRSNRHMTFLVLL